MNKNNIITVKNAEGDPDTQAEIIIQNKIDYIPKVSVIIPVYNVEEYLRECLDSVVNQTLKEIEIICVDDGSTDNSLEILKEYAQKDNRITVITQNNSGSGTARNCGINIAKGDFIAFMDSDDIYPENKTLSTIYIKTTENNALICGGSVNQIKDGKLITDTSNFEEGYSFKQEGFVDYKDYQFDYGYWRFIYNRNFLIENLIFFPNYKRYQDPPFFVKSMILAKKFYALKEATYIYRISHKKIQWTEEKVLDVYKGKLAVLNMCKENNLLNLYNKTARSCISTWLLENIKPVITKHNYVQKYILNIINSIDKSLLTTNISIPDMLTVPIKISVIISIYNTEKYLRECLDSVINQTLKNIEIICVNDGSTDNSSKILKEYAVKDKRIIIIEQKNQGLSCSRNNAMKIAKGEYIQFLDSDDYLKSDTIEKLYNFANKNDLELCSFSGYNFIDGENELLENKYWDFDFLPTDFNCDHFNYKDCFDFINKLPVSSCLTIYKNDFIKKHHFEFPKGLCFEDNVFYSKALLSAQRCGILKEKLYCRRIHGNSITQNWDKHFYDYIKIVDILLSWIKQNKIELYNTYKNHYLTGILNRFKNFNTGIKKLYIKKLKDLIERYTTCFDSLSLISLAQGICNEDFSINPPLLFKDLGVGCNTWCEPKTITGDNIKSYTYDLSDNIYTRYVSWDPIREGSCDVEIMRLSAIEKQSKRIVEFPINEIISNGEIINNKVEFHNQKGCWIGCKIEGTYESFSIEAKIENIH